MVLFGLGHSNISSFNDYKFGNYGYIKREGYKERLLCNSKYECSANFRTKLYYSLR